MNPYREDREPCRDCAKRAAEALQAEEQERAMKAAKKFNYSAFFTVIGIALGVGVFGVLVVNCAGERREHCYEVREYSSFEGSLQVREFNLWWGSDRREVRKFPDTESARRFAATKNLVMCR